MYIQSFKQVRFKFYLFPIQSLFSKMGYPIFLSKNRQYEHLLINAKELDGLKKKLLNLIYILLKGVNLDSSDLSRQHCTYMSWLGVKNCILQYQMFRGEQRVNWSQIL